MFTNNWFEVTAIRNFEKHVLPLKEKALNFLEVGCYEGQASVWMLENSNAKLTVVDTFKGGQDLPDEENLLHRFTDNVKEHRDRVSINMGKSQRILKEFASDTEMGVDFYDFIYIDGSHLACDVLEDAILAFPLLKNGGIMIFDDYTWGQGMSPFDVPSMGINTFLSVYGNKIKVLEKNSQVVIEKN